MSEQQPADGRPDPWSREFSAPGNMPPSTTPQDPTQPYPSQQYPGYPQPQYPGYAPQQPYPQNAPQAYPPYSPQAYGQAPPPQGYGSYPPTPYDQSQYGGGPAPYGPPADRPGSLGTIALIIVGVCAIVLIAANWVMGGVIGNLMIDLGPEAAAQLDPDDPAMLALADRIGAWSTAAVFATLAGIGGWIVGIVAFNRRQARTHALWAIILGIAAPVLAFVALVMAMWPAVAALS